MTSVLVITHAHGVLAAYTQVPGEELRQRAVIDTGDTEPAVHADLAKLGIELAERYGWTANDVAPARGAGRPALPPDERRERKRQQSRESYQRRKLDPTELRETEINGDGPSGHGVQLGARRKRPYKSRLRGSAIAARREVLLAWVHDHPDSTTRDMALALSADDAYPTYEGVVASINKDLKALGPALVATRIPVGDPRRAEFGIRGNAPLQIWRAVEGDDVGDDRYR